MRRQNIYIFVYTLVLCLTACENDTPDMVDEPFTWGDASELITTAYCDTLVDCRLLKPDQVWPCKRHIFHHLCELEDLCDTSLPEGAREAAWRCHDAIVEECTFYLPKEECTPIFEYEPDTQ